MQPQPMASVATPMPAPIATPAPTTVHARRGGHGALYAVLALLVIGGGGAGIYVATRPSDPKPAGADVVRR